jgi:hypothetical protein
MALEALTYSSAARPKMEALITPTGDHRPLSFLKIISARSDDAIRTGWVWR